MQDDDLLVLSGREVLALLKGREREILDAVEQAYCLHTLGESSLPHSIFLRFPDNPRNRIIALPAQLGGDFDLAGMKWISSFPGNVERGLDRASAAMILNSTRTGRPLAFFEAAVISAKRTAASAALAARTLHRGDMPSSVGLIGTGVINFEVALFLRAVFPEIKQLLIFDMNGDRAAQFASKALREFEGVKVKKADNIEEVLGKAPLVSFATTALSPHISDLSNCPQPSTILHVSLRDLTAEAILTCDNVVDDIDHVCRAETSVHLAEQSVGNRDFIRCTLGELLLERGGAATTADAAGSRSQEGTTIFSPFGLGILDLAVGKLVYELGRRHNKGTIINSFASELWFG